MLRRTPMHRRSRKTGPTAEVVAVVLERDGHACVRCGLAATGERGRDWSLHHRRARGMGGSRRPDTNLPSNLITVCGSGTQGCHGELERCRADSYVHGWLVRRNDDTDLTQVAVLVDHGSRWVYLTEAGTYADQPPTVDGAR